MYLFTPVKPVVHCVVSTLVTRFNSGNGIKLGIQLNDRLIVKGKRYIINSYTVDLTTAEANFELLSDYRGVDAVNTVGYRYASMQDIQVDNTGAVIDLEIYLNDFDEVDIPLTTAFTTYTPQLNVKADTQLQITIPANGTGLDRYDEITMDYWLNGVNHKDTIVIYQTL